MEQQLVHTIVRRSLETAFISLLLALLVCNYAAADDTEDLKLAMARLEANISRCRPQGVQIWFKRLKLLSGSEMHGERVMLLIERYQPRVQAVENDDQKISRMLATLDLVSLRKQLADSCDLRKQRSALSSLEKSFRSLDLSENCLSSPRVTSIRDLIKTGRKTIEAAEHHQRELEKILARYKTDWDKAINDARSMLVDPSAVKQLQANQMIKSLDDISVAAQSRSSDFNAECANESPLMPYEKSALELRTKLAALTFDRSKPETGDSEPPAEVSVPSVVSLSLEEAKRILARAGLTAELRGGEAAPEEAKTLHVQLQRPSAGLPVPKNKIVTIVLYSPPHPPLIVPRVVGADIKNANEMLNAMGFRVVVEGDSKSAGSVVSVQKPGAGQYLTVGSEIRLQTEKKPVDADEASFNY